MVSSLASIIFEMLYLMVYTTIKTSINVLKLFFELLLSLSYIIYISGPLGIVISFIILTPLVYVIIKFFSGGIKLILLIILISSFFFILLIFLMSF